jgi:hypothetical protein
MEAKCSSEIRPTLNGERGVVQKDRDLHNHADKTSNSQVLCPTVCRELSAASVNLGFLTQNIIKQPSFIRKKKKVML